MKALGFDYGTTTSLLETFELNSDQHGELIQLLRCRSEWQRDGYYIPSPKRLLTQQNVETTETGEPIVCAQTTITDVICQFTEGMIERCSTLSSTEQMFLTLTVPDSFTNFECSLMLKAISKAFSTCFGSQFDPSQNIAIVPEPVAAAFYYTYTNLNTLSRNSGYKDLVVCDIGGGTTDLAIVRTKVVALDEPTQDHNTRYNLSFNVLATYGSSQLGGNDVTKVLVKKMSERHGLNTHITNSKWFWDSCEELKIRLSDPNLNPEKLVIVFVKDLNGNTIQIDGVSLYISCSRQELETWTKEENQWTGGLGNKLRDCISNVKEIATKKIKELRRGSADYPGINFNKITLVPVGGSMRLPLFREILKQEWGGQPVMADVVNDDGIFDCVARGAALYSAHEIMQLPLIHDLSLEYRTPFCISVGHGEDCVKECIPRNSVAGDYEAILYPLKIDNKDHSFCLSEFVFYQSAHRINTTTLAKRFGALSLGGMRRFIDNDCDPRNKQLKLEFKVDVNIRRVGVRLRINRVKLDGTFYQSYQYPQRDYHYLNF